MGNDGASRSGPTLLVWCAAALLPAWWLNGPSLDEEVQAAAETPAYSLADLRRYNGEPDGTGDGTILLAVLGRVFNVTSGEEFYAAGAGYHVFAGHDCSRAFALTSTKAKWLDKDLEGLAQAKLEHLNETYWGTYAAKYPIVGRLIDPPYDPAAYDHFAGPYASIRPSGPGSSQAAGRESAARPRRKSRCPVTRAARAVGNTIAQILPRQLLSSA
mmetsp:Transcript_51998/g.104562  ORF Transcript_51998/g.104562 Transcript_51998/m.104562 type:complete len:215 (-) Transcript_51998:138-782(-)